MAPKKKGGSSAKTAAKEEPRPKERPKDIYVLSLTSVNHANYHRPETSIVGAYDSKWAAAAASTSVDTEYGDFDSAIADMFEDDHVDNRDDPPENGCMIKIGSSDSGEGDYVELTIQKLPLQTLASVNESSTNKKKKAKKRKIQSYDDEEDDVIFL